MEIATEAELIALGMMFFAMMLKLLGFYYTKKASEPDTKLEPYYIVTGLMAVLVMWAGYQVHTTDLIAVAKDVVLPTMGLNVLFEVPAKLKKAPQVQPITQE